MFMVTYSKMEDLQLWITPKVTTDETQQIVKYYEDDKWSDCSLKMRVYAYSVSWVLKSYRLRRQIFLQHLNPTFLYICNIY